MKRYFKEIIILFIQLLRFYIFPLSAGPTDTMGMVVLIILSVLILSIVMGSISNEKFKYLYPLIVSIIFIPSIFIYFNESAFIYCLWFLVISFVGIFIGTIIYKLRK